MVMARHYVLAAGGTGGHMIPAHALAEELLARGHRVALITDDRGARIPGLFDKVQVHVLPAGRLAGGPVGWLRAARSIATGRAMALRLYETFLPSAVIGFGGYPAFPALLAARRDRIPTLIHEQNAVLGRVNRLMAGKVDAIATAYKSVQRLPAKALLRFVLSEISAHVIDSSNSRTRRGGSFCDSKWSQAPLATPARSPSRQRRPREMPAPGTSPKQESGQGFLEKSNT